MTKEITGHSFADVAARVKAQQDAFLAMPPEEQARRTRETAIQNARVLAEYGEHEAAEAELAPFGLSLKPPARPRTRKVPA